MKLYDIRYTISTGKIVLRDIDKQADDDGFVSFGLAGYGRIGRDFFHTEEGARDAFAAKRKKKIASLRKQIGKLETLSPVVGASA